MLRDIGRRSIIINSLFNLKHYIGRLRSRTLNFHSGRIILDRHTKGIHHIQIITTKSRWKVLRRKRERARCVSNLIRSEIMMKKSGSHTLQTGNNIIIDFQLKIFI